jgi:quinone-modifying oxidoreductase, subunit QmoB
MADIKREKRIGVYLCSGCGIGGALDMKALKKMAASELEPALCRQHAALCSKEGVAVINKDIAGNSVNTVLVAACSSRVKTQEFAVDADKVLERLGLRELVAWTQKPKNEDTQMMAEDYLRMSFSRAKATEPPVPWFETAEEKIINKDILIIGGGVTGLTAAREVSKAGYNAVLVEKESQLGGFAAKLSKITPSKPPYIAPEENSTATLISEVLNDPNITVLTSTTIRKIKGAPGMFDTTFENCADTKEKRVGAILLASGWKPYDAFKLVHLGYGKSPNIITNIRMEELAAQGAIMRPSDGKEAKSIAFIQCAGSRDENHLAYCSSVCCQVSIKQALHFTKANAGATAYIIHKDMRTPGLMENFYKNAQEDPGLLLTKGDVVSVDAEAGGSVLIEVDNTFLGEKIKIRADMVVLATGMVPSTLVEEAAGKTGANILNLTYRKGTDLPTLKYGFPDSHYICFPYETQRTGIYTAGAVRAPLGISDSKSDATGAALKAIQCVELTGRGNTVHPRTYDTAFPEFFLQRCTQCKRCTEECPFRTLDEDEKGTPQPYPTRCRRCGVCMGACPERIVSFKNYSVAMISDMIKSIHVPGEDDGKPRIIGLVCENDAWPALDIMALQKHGISPWIRFIPIRCLGSVNTVWVADAMSKGIDGILLLGCRYGDDYQCHFIEGSALCQTRVNNIAETLDKLALESNRIKMVQVALTDYNTLAATINEFCTAVSKLDPNPYKGL